MRRCNKKTKSSEKNDREERRNSEEIPLDLEIEILKRLPVKSVERFLMVSKLWATIIRSQDFIKSFPSQPPRLLVAFLDTDRVNECQNWYYFSTTSFLSCVTCPFPIPERLVYNRRTSGFRKSLSGPRVCPRREYYSHHVNGLISLGNGQDQIICNPNNGKSITLPRVKNTGPAERVAESLFGYDSINDQYKVLCMTRRRDYYGMNNDHNNTYQLQVYTLGAHESWRMVECSIPHLSWSKGVCIDGVLYYAAYTSEAELSLMRFYLRSEKLDVFSSLSSYIQSTYHQVDCREITLMNYAGKVAIPTKTSPYTFKVWIMEETHEWLQKSFSINIKPRKRGCGLLRITGATSTGEFILAPLDYSDKFTVFYYNPDTDILRNIKIQVNKHYEFKRCSTRPLVFSDYVESIRLL